MIRIKQWDVVRVRINPNDKEEHPAVIVSPDEICAQAGILRINVLYGTSLRPDMKAKAHHVILNGAEGLDNRTLINCAHFYQIDPAKIISKCGQVGPIRRRKLADTIKAVFRLY